MNAGETGDLSEFGERFVVMKADVRGVQSTDMQCLRGSLWNLIR
jgi:hypothetical protein